MHTVDRSIAKDTFEGASERRPQYPSIKPWFLLAFSVEMSAIAKDKRDVTLPEGVSLTRVAQVLLEAWEADPKRWLNAASALREGPGPSTMPVPQDALDLFRLLTERRVNYLLVGGMAMLTYVKGRNTKYQPIGGKRRQNLRGSLEINQRKYENRLDISGCGPAGNVVAGLHEAKQPQRRHVA